VLLLASLTSPNGAYAGFLAESVWSRIRGPAPDYEFADDSRRHSPYAASIFAAVISPVSRRRHQKTHQRRCGRIYLLAAGRNNWPAIRGKPGRSRADL